MLNIARNRSKDGIQDSHIELSRNPFPSKDLELGIVFFCRTFSPPEMLGFGASGFRPRAHRLQALAKVLRFGV